MSDRNSKITYPPDDKKRIGSKRNAQGQLLGTPQYKPTIGEDGVTRTSDAPSASVMAHGGALSPTHDSSYFNEKFRKKGVPAAPTGQAPAAPANPTAPAKADASPDGESGGGWWGMTKAAATPAKEANPAMNNTGAARNWWDGPVDSPRIQAELDRAAPGGNVAGAAGQNRLVRTPYGVAGSRTAAPGEVAAPAVTTGTGVQRGAPLNWQQQIVQEHPEVGVAGSRGNQAFVDAYQSAYDDGRTAEPGFNSSQFARNVMSDHYAEQAKANPISLESLRRPFDPKASMIAKTTGDGRDRSVTAEWLRGTKVVGLEGNNTAADNERYRSQLAVGPAPNAASVDPTLRPRANAGKIPGRYANL